MQSLSLYAFFHINICFSSIEVEQRKEVIRKCYWPLLRLARKLVLPIGIELTGYTLESIAEIDSSWVDELRNLINEGVCEFIGSGYSQIIGPLVPAQVNIKNLSIGNDIYKKILGTHPTVALVNEQAYSSGLIRHYLDAGYRAIVMEWDNPARSNPEWDPDWRYYPQYACDQHGNRIALIWNNSISFQKFQRYSHNEIELNEYLKYLATHFSDTRRVFPLYGNDVEIFDFRPGRFQTEAFLGDMSEWARIENLFKKLADDSRFELIFPSDVLKMLKHANGGNSLHLESSECPTPVKKQGKYNITRWAVTGRDDLRINTTCWRIYNALGKKSQASMNDWKELCYLWSSDFRTHITRKRWEAYCKRLKAFEKKFKSKKTEPPPSDFSHSNELQSPSLNTGKIDQQGKYLTIETDSIRIRLNCRRGLAIDSLWFKNVSQNPLIGTLPHGYYDDISLGADFYSGHLIFETPGKPKVTDLNPVKPLVYDTDDGASIVVSVRVPTIMGDVHKLYSISKKKSEVKLSYQLDWDDIPIGSLRLGHITLIPSSFDRHSLFYRSHNGGMQPETFPLKDPFDHGSTVSFLVSGASAVGMTEKNIEIGDNGLFLSLRVDKAAEAPIGMLTYRIAKDNYFYRLALSISEMDDTSRLKSPCEMINPTILSLTLFSEAFNVKRG
ncbi:glycoside hydrolase family 57 [Desulfospira joergensenii]|uniref:glycoside hydrolase family 57 n=1 Tax=Desulfospira joergensenii TaxID=53329 RepID=UPI0003B666BF|nr:glycoside hydrolase family 57 [Desulfospira joergensenii]